MTTAQHPRFPFGMEPEVRVAISDEVDVTFSAYPSKRPLPAAITAYAEQLAGFVEPSDIREGFTAARRGAGEFAPNPAQVRACVALACRQRRERTARPAPHHDAPDFCLRCHTPDLIELANGRFAPLHADDCPGLHPNDRLDLQHALAIGQPIWRHGADPNRDRRPMPERLQALGLLAPNAEAKGPVPLSQIIGPVVQQALAPRVAAAPDSSTPLLPAPHVPALEARDFTLED